MAPEPHPPLRASPQPSGGAPVRHSHVAERAPPSSGGTVLKQTPLKKLTPGDVVRMMGRDYVVDSTEARRAGSVWVRFHDGSYMHGPATHTVAVHGEAIA